MCRSECGIVLIGNKLDLSSIREISIEDGFKYCEDNSKKYLIKDILHLECSALNGENIDEIFSLLSKNILSKIDNGLINPNSIMANSTFVKTKKDNLNGNNSLSCSKC